MKAVHLLKHQLQLTQNDIVLINNINPILVFPQFLTERPDLIALSQRPPGEQGELIAFLAGIFASRSRDEWVAWFADKDVAFSPVLDFAEAFTSAHVAERGLIVEAGGGHHIGPAIRFASESWAPRPAPELDNG